MTDTKYNGWTNYETWNVALWLSEEDWQGQNERTIRKLDTYDLGKHLQEYIEEFVPDIKGCYADMLNASIRAVNWHEIATNYKSELEEEAA